MRKCDTTNSSKTIATLQEQLQRLISPDQGGRSARTKKYTAEHKRLRTEYRACRRNLLMRQSIVPTAVGTEGYSEDAYSFVGATNSMAISMPENGVRPHPCSVQGLHDRPAFQSNTCSQGSLGELRNFWDWMTQRAKEGDSAATRQLLLLLLGKMPDVSISTVPPQVTIESRNPTERRPPSPFLNVIGKVGYRVHLESGNVRYGFPGKLLLVDEGNRIAVYEENDIAYATALKIGYQSFGNQLHVTGTADGLLAVVRMAAKHRLPVQFTDQEMNKLLREVLNRVRRGTLTDGSGVQAAWLGANETVRISGAA